MNEANDRVIVCVCVKFPGTDPEEQSFSVFLGDVPADVTLAAVRLNGVELAVPFEHASRYTLTEESQAYDTHGYVLEVPLDDAVVMQQVKKRLRRRVLSLRWQAIPRQTLLCLPALQRRGCDALQTGHQLHADGFVREEAVSPRGISGAAAGRR